METFPWHHVKNSSANTCTESQKKHKGDGNCSPVTVEIISFSIFFPKCLQIMCTTLIT